MKQIETIYTLPKTLKVGDYVRAIWEGTYLLNWPASRIMFEGYVTRKSDELTNGWILVSANGEDHAIWDSVYFSVHIIARSLVTVDTTFNDYMAEG